jgi:hypothetical protein
MHAFQCFAFFLTEQFSRYIFKNEIRVRFTLVRATYSGIPLLKNLFCFETYTMPSQVVLKILTVLTESETGFLCSTDNLYNSAAQTLL